jgi:hypothetical protein
MGHIGSAADCIGDDNRPVTDIDRAKDCGEHANVGFTSGNEQRIDAGVVQTDVQFAGMPWCRFAFNSEICRVLVSKTAVLALKCEMKARFGR